MTEPVQPEVDYTSLYIADLDPDIDDDDLREAITNEGILVKHVSTFPGRQANSLKTGIVTFNNPDDARRAMLELNHLTLGETEISISYSRKAQRGQKIKIPPDQAVHISSVPPHLTASMIHNSFAERFGEVETARIHRGRNNEPLGYGEVLFVDPLSAARAIEFDGKKLSYTTQETEEPQTFEEPLVIKPFVPKVERKEFKIFLRGFDDVWKMEDVRAVLEEIAPGAVKQVLMVPYRVKENGHFSFVTFETVEGMTAVLNRTKTMIPARPPLTTREGVEILPEWRLYSSSYQTKEDRQAERLRLVSAGCCIEMTGFPKETLGNQKAVFKQLDDLLLDYTVFSYVLHTDPRGQSGATQGKYPRIRVTFTSEDQAHAAEAALRGREAFGGVLEVRLHRDVTKPTHGIPREQMIPRHPGTAEPIDGPLNQYPAMVPGQFPSGPFPPMVYPPMQYQQVMTDPVLVDMTERILVAEMGQQPVNARQNAVDFVSRLFTIMSVQEINSTRENPELLKQYLREMFD